MAQDAAQDLAGFVYPCQVTGVQDEEEPMGCAVVVAPGAAGALAPGQVHQCHLEPVHPQAGLAGLHGGQHLAGQRCVRGEGRELAW